MYAMPTVGIRVRGRGQPRRVGGVAVRAARAGARSPAHVPAARPHVLSPPVYAHASSRPDEGARHWGKCQK